MITICGVRSYEWCVHLQPSFRLDSDAVLPRITSNFSLKKSFDTSYTRAILVHLDSSNLASHLGRRIGIVPNEFQ